MSIFLGETYCQQKRIIWMQTWLKKIKPSTQQAMKIWKRKKIKIESTIKEYDLEIKAINP